MEESEILKEAGLTVNESKVYGALVKHGKMGATKICSTSGIPYGRVYDVLNSLINKSLVKVLPEKTKKFTITSPDYLVKNIEEREDKIHKAKEKAHELKKFYESREEEVVQVSYGKKGFKQLADEAKFPEKYSYYIRWNAEVSGNSIENAKVLKNNDVDVRHLVRYDENTKKNVHEYMKVNSNFRKIENNGVAISISDDEEVFMGLIKSNTTILIRDPNLAKVLKKMFLRTYESAPRIEQPSKKSKS